MVIIQRARFTILSEECISARDFVDGLGDGFKGFVKMGDGLAFGEDLQLAAFELALSFSECRRQDVVGGEL